MFSDPRLEDAYPMAAQAYDSHGITVSSMANLFMYMHLAATSLGLASQWVSATTHPLPQALIKQLLGVPRSFILYDTMIVGYPDQTPPPRLVRTREEFSHINSYDKSRYRDDTQVREFIHTIHKRRIVAAD